ncbi:MAG: hypothetical protein ACI83P_001728 [Janthinobacterium sp.]|jgi:hypothetical protein
MNQSHLVPEQAQDHVNGERLHAAIAALVTFSGRDDGGVARETLAMRVWSPVSPCSNWPPRPVVWKA